jgi:hypothetical protein
LPSIKKADPGFWTVLSEHLSVKRKKTPQERTYELICYCPDTPAGAKMRTEVQVHLI